MIINNFDIRGFSGVRHLETDAILIVDADAVLPGSVAAETFKMVGGRYPQIVYVGRVMEHHHFPQSSFLNGTRQFTGKSLMEYFFGFLIRKILYHDDSF